MTGLAAKLETLRRRPSVRALIAAEHRLAPAGRRMVLALGAAEGAVEPLGLRWAAIRARRELPNRRYELAKAIAAAVDPPVEMARSTTVIVVVDGTGQTVDLGIAKGSVLVVEAGIHPPTPHEPVLSNQSPDRGVAEQVFAAVAECTTDLVCLVRSTVNPVDPAWLLRLSSLVADGTALVTPLVLHAERPWTAATKLDLLVREAGLRVDRDIAGRPRLRFRGSGLPATGSDHPCEVVAASATCAVFDRSAAAAVGGLDPLLGVDLGVVDLCLRLGASGQRICCDPSTLVTDDRRVPSYDALCGPVDDRSDQWRLLVERYGSSLLDQAASGPAARPVPQASFALTVASPSRKVADKWGDWHLAEALADALRRAGHHVVVQTADQADSLAGRVADVHVVLRGLAPVRATAGQAQVLWVISHPESVTADECNEADLVLVASPRFAEELTRRTSTPVAVLLQATDPNRFRPMPVDPGHRHRVTIVAKSRDVMRPMVADAIAAGLRPAIYGSGWSGLVDTSLIVAEHVPNEELATVYSSAGVVLNDHWETMRTWGFVSNRVFDVLACSAPLISDPLPELTELFGDLVATSSGPVELRSAVESILSDPDLAAERSARARGVVLGAHTFDRRVEQLLALLDAHSIVSAAGPTRPTDRAG